MSRSNKVVVKECRAALNNMKYEIAAEFGLVNSDYIGKMDAEFADEIGSFSGTGGNAGHVHWSTLSTRQAGSVGGEITRRLISQAEQVLNPFQL